MTLTARLVRIALWLPVVIVWSMWVKNMKDSDILLHEFVPKHEILSKEDAEKLLASLGVSKDKLSKILLDDPVVRAIGAKSGDILKITRKSPTAGHSVYYRVVVED